MKIKFLSLLLLLVGALTISACVNSEAQAFTGKAPGDMYRNIFCPYTGLQERGEPEMPAPHPPFPPEGFRPRQKPMPDLRDATYLLDSNIEKAENISIRLETGIERYKAEGEDVSRPEALLEEYTLLVEEAKQYRSLADAAAGKENNSSILNSDSYNGPSEEMEIEYLIRSQKSMIEANHVLKDIFNELNYLMHGNEELNSTFRLISAGEGKALLMGSFTLNLHLENGEMAIADLSRDSEIDISGDYTFEEKMKGPDKVRLYYINSADVKVSGFSKTVMLNNENITLIADGEGYATFQGDGTYRVEDAGRTVREDNWAKPFFEERMNPGGSVPDGEDNISGYGPDRIEEITEYVPEEDEDIQDIPDFIPEDEDIQDMPDFIPEDEDIQDIPDFIPEDEDIQDIPDFIPEDEDIQDISEFIPEDEDITEPEYEPEGIEV